MFSHKITTSTWMQRDTAANFLRTDSSTQYPKKNEKKKYKLVEINTPPTTTN